MFVSLDVQCCGWFSNFLSLIKTRVFGVLSCHYLGFSGCLGSEEIIVLLSKSLATLQVSIAKQYSEAS